MTTQEQDSTPPTPRYRQLEEILSRFRPIAGGEEISHRGKYRGDFNYNALEVEGLLIAAGIKDIIKENAKYSLAGNQKDLSTVWIISQDDFEIFKKYIKAQIAALKKPTLGR